MTRSITHATRAEWLATRRLGVGSSDIATILGASSYTSPYALWADKVSDSTPDELPADIESPMYWGSMLEGPIAACGYAIMHPDRAVIIPDAFEIVRHPEYPFLQASPDRYVYDPKRGNGVLEIKFMNGFAADQWADGPPLQYQVQLQHQLLCTGHTWGSICVLLGGKFQSWDFDAHPRIQQVIIDKAREFWELVQTRTAPAIDGSESTANAIAALCGRREETTVLMPEDFLALDEEAEALARTIKMAEERRSEIRNTIRAYIGEHRHGLISGTNVQYRIGNPSESIILHVDAERAAELDALNIPYETKVSKRAGAMTRSARDKKPKQIAAQPAQPMEIETNA